MDCEKENFHYSRILNKRISTTVAAAKRWVLKKRISTTEAVGNAVEEVAEDGGNEKPGYAAVSRLQKHYKILKKEDIRQLQDNDISTVTGSLSVSRGVACALLCRNNWSLSSVYDIWFAEEERACEPDVGILANKKSQGEVCNICYDKIRPENMASAACGHPFCADCLKTYITTSINDSPGCLTLRCPEPACKATVGLDMVDRLVSGDDRDKYYQHLHRSYVESSRNRKWCPAPGCDLAIEFDTGKCRSYDVTCDCSHKFCWKCTEESHRPVDCKAVAEWLEDSSEAQSTTWKLHHTKSCPKCCRPIEKYYGCSHMKCASPCGFQFCWVCLGPWKDHVLFSSCRKVVTRKDTTKHLDKYTLYYENIAFNDKCRKRALLDLDRARNLMLALSQQEPKGQVQSVIEAWDQIVECRRVLKWTYVYGYYLSSKNSRAVNLFLCPTNSRRMNYFRNLLREAEAALQKLHCCAQTEMDKYLNVPREDFKDFELKLADITAVTRNYFESLVVALEKTSKTSDYGKPRKSSKNRKHQVHKAS